MAAIFKIFFLILLSGCTSVLLYHPDRYLHGDPHAFGIEFKEFYFKSYDGTRLLAWDLKSKNENPENLVVMFHGNAENLSSHIFNLAWMVDHKTDVLIFDYRGYGLSEGTPYPRGINEDSVRFLQLAYDKFKTGHYKHFIVYTQSLGGAVAMRALEDIPWRNDISLLVLDSTFISPQQVAKTKLGGLFWWLISSEYTADKSLKHLTMPVLVIHAKADPVVPYQFGEEIYQRLPTKKKEMWTLNDKDAYHGSVFYIFKGHYRKQFLNYISSLDH